MCFQGETCSPLGLVDLQSVVIYSKTVFKSNFEVHYWSFSILCYLLLLHYIYIVKYYTVILISCKKKCLVGATCHVSDV